MRRGHGTAAAPVFVTDAPIGNLEWLGVSVFLTQLGKGRRALGRRAVIHVVTRVHRCHGGDVDGNIGLCADKLTKA